MRLITAREEIFLATVRVLTGDSVATAFLFSYAPEGSEAAYFVVTNAHVIAEKQEADLFFLQADAAGVPILGSPYIYSTKNFEAMWHRHPNPHVDVAVARFSHIQEDADSRGVQIANRWLTMKHAFDDIPPDPSLDIRSLIYVFGVEVDAIEEVLFVGYPSGYYDRRNHLPIVRRGTTATSPFGYYEGESAFLIDAPILPGSSGSPVFIVDSASVRHRPRGLERFLFMGIVSEFLPFKTPGKPPRPVASEADRLTLLTGLGLVYKPSVILETIKSCIASTTGV